MRRVIVRGDLFLFDYLAKVQLASGGFAAGIDVRGDVNFGTQQQWITRDSTFRKAMSGGAWSLVFVGVEFNEAASAPSTRARAERQPAYSVVDQSPIIAEKPFISIDSEGKYSLMVPRYKSNSSGFPVPEQELEDEISFEQVFVARAGDSSTNIQAALDDGYHVIFSPGIYYLSDALLITKDGQVVLGIGMATLVSSCNGCIKVKAGIKAVRIAGLTLQACQGYTACLLEVGEDTVPSGDASMPCVLSDIFVRVGGPLMKDGLAHRESIEVGNMVVIHSNCTIGDNLW